MLRETPEGIYVLVNLLGSATLPLLATICACAPGTTPRGTGTVDSTKGTIPWSFEGADGASCYVLPVPFPESLPYEGSADVLEVGRSDPLVITWEPCPDKKTVHIHIAQREDPSAKYDPSDESSYLGKGFGVHCTNVPNSGEWSLPGSIDPLLVPGRWGAVWILNYDASPTCRREKRLIVR